MIVTYKVQCEDCKEVLAVEQIFEDATLIQTLHKHSLGHTNVILQEE